MAALSLYHHIARWFSNKGSWTSMTWWKTSFNLPVPNLFDDSSIPSDSEWFLNSILPATSFWLFGFFPWLECICLSNVITVYWYFPWWILNISNRCFDPNSLVIAEYSMSIDYPVVSSGGYYFHQILYNLWVCSWEISLNWTYTFETICSWALSWIKSTTVTISQCPSVAQLDYSQRWYIWIEWDNLCWVSWNSHIHKVSWVYIWSNSSFWSIWVEWNNIHWTWSSWNEYRWSVVIKQFSSSFSPWANPWVVSWQTPWYIWVDTNFWYEHLAFIWSDWYKYIFADWENPY